MEDVREGEETDTSSLRQGEEEYTWVDVVILDLLERANTNSRKYLAMAYNQSKADIGGGSSNGLL